MRCPTLALLLTPKDSDLTFFHVQKAIFGFPIDRLKGELYLSPLIARDSVRGLVRSHASLVEQEHLLSVRQKEVLQLLAEGKQMKEVANALNIAPRTVAFHKYRIMGVLKVNNDADLVRYALRQSMIAA